MKVHQTVMMGSGGIGKSALTFVPLEYGPSLRLNQG